MKRPMSEIIDDLNKAKASYYRSSCRLAFLRGVLVGVIISFATMAILLYSST